jgi:putative phage-type endonuclease
MEKNEWLEWRRLGIGGSDAPVVMGVSPYASPYMLWEEKTKRKTDDKKNTFILDKGNKYEPFARAKYELHNDAAMPAMRAIHKDIPWLRATMDGFNVEQNVGIEIKYIGEEEHERIKKEKTLPFHHYVQVQHQLIVTGAKWIDYLSFYVESGKNENGEKIIPDPKNGKLEIVRVELDHEFLKNYMAIAEKFWSNVTSDTPPDLIDMDVRLIEKHDDIANSYIKTSELLSCANILIKKIELDLEDIKKQIINISKDYAKVTFGSTGLVVVKGSRKGTVQYEKIPELKNVDLDMYRKESSTTYSIKYGK